MRVHMTEGHEEVTDNGVKTVYHGGRSFQVSDELGAKMRALGKCLLADEKNEPIPDPEPEPEPEAIAAEPEPTPPSFDAAEPGVDEDDEPTEED